MARKEFQSAQQIASESGDKLLAPEKKHDDPRAWGSKLKIRGAGQTQIGRKHDVDDTRLENQRVAMEDVR